MVRKKLTAILAVCLVTALTTVSSFAEQKGRNQKNEEEVKVVIEETQTSNSSYNNGKGNESKNPEQIRKELEKYTSEIKITRENAIAQKKAVEELKDALEERKDELEAEKDALEKLYEEAKKAENSELATDLLEKLQLARVAFNDAKNELKQAIGVMRDAVKNTYTEEELEELEQLTNRIEALDKNIKVLPVQNVIARGRNIKFDTPPVIKLGRTLIPVRALTEAFGAKVEYIPQEQKVMITKGDIVIILVLNDTVALVNGVETQLDVPSELMNNRTIVPLRFILESLGLKVKWDGETEVIEIDDEESTPAEDADEADDTDADESEDPADSEEDSESDETDESEDPADSNEDTDADGANESETPTNSEES